LRNGSAKDLNDDAPFNTSGQKSGGIFFNESLTLSEIEKLESAPNNPKDINQVSPVYFVNTPPPGITPSRYPQKSNCYTYSDMAQTPTNNNMGQQQTNEFPNPSPQMMRND